MYFPEKCPDRLLGVGNNGIHIFLMQRFLYVTSVDFHRFFLLD